MREDKSKQQMHGLTQQHEHPAEIGAIANCAPACCTILRPDAACRAALATPSLLLQLLDLFRTFRFGPIFVVFFPGFAAQRLEIGALRASHHLIFCYPLVGVFLRIE